MPASKGKLSVRNKRQGLSGLTGRRRRKALRLTMQAAKLGYRNAADVHYTQTWRRWEGIATNLKAYKGQYPNYADCSSFATWCLWNGLAHYGLPDNVNKQDWKAGYTGTMVNCGKRVKRPRRGDLIVYGNPFGGSGHVAVYDRFGLCYSHGSEGGPYHVPYTYRKDIYAIIRYV